VDTLGWTHLPDLTLGYGLGPVLNRVQKSTDLPIELHGRRRVIVGENNHRPAGGAVDLEEGLDAGGPARNTDAAAAAITQRFARTRRGAGAA
jgi:hypothetical protein